MQEKKKKKSTAIFYIIAAIIVLYLLRNGVFNNRIEINNQAQEMYNVDTLTKLQLLNKMKLSIDSTCPKKIDSVTELENTSVIGSDTFQYNYLLKLDRNKYNVNILKKELAQQVLSQWINKSGFNEFKKRNISVVFSYQDMSKEYWFKEIFSPSNSYNPQ
jgi:hypothetical protein